MRGALISGLSCATCSASARRAGCRIAGRPSWPRFWRSWALPDAGWSRFPHGTYPGPLCSGVPHQTPPPAIPQRRPLTPRAAKVEYSDLQKAGQSASRVGLLRADTSLKERSFVALAEEDPNLALAGLRIEIEKRLRAIAARRGIENERMGIGQLLSALSSAGALSNEQRSVLSDLTGTLNMAVHGAEVNRRSADWAIDVGSRLLASLDDLTG